MFWESKYRGESDPGLCTTLGLTKRMRRAVTTSNMFAYRSRLVWQVSLMWWLNNSKSVTLVTHVCCYKTRKFLLRLPPWAQSKIPGSCFGLDVARGNQSNIQGTWPCKLPIDSLPLLLLVAGPLVKLEQTTSPKLSNVSCRVTRDKKQVTVRCDDKKSEIPKNIINWTSPKISKITRLIGFMCHSDPTRACHQPVFWIQCLLEIKRHTHEIWSRCINMYLENFMTYVII